MKMNKFKRRNIPLCACGCGKRTKQNYHNTRWNKYIKGHENKNRRASNETRRKMSIAATGKRNPNYGKPRSEETKNKISKINKGRKVSEETKKKISKTTKGEKSFNYGKPRSEETKNKISKARMGQFTGNNNPNWREGISCEPYCDIWLDQGYKQSIKDRDNNECQNPDCRKNCNHMTLCLHHINYNKKDCPPKNLITLCISCNARANFNREICTDFYQNIMSEKYKYCYAF